MYATGMRVSEVVRVKWKDVDFDRQLINVWQGKGRTDRQVMLLLGQVVSHGNSADPAGSAQQSRPIAFTLPTAAGRTKSPLGQSYHRSHFEEPPGLLHWNASVGGSSGICDP